MSMKMIAAALTVFGAATVVADVAVTGVKVQPRSPWNGLVDVEYTLVCDDPEAEVYVNPVGYDGDRGITLFPSAFTGDAMEGPVKAGKHTLVWDARKDFGYSFSCANFQLKFYAGKHLAPYVIIDLSGGSSATNYPVRFSTKGPDLSSDVCRTTELWMRLIPPGSFMMGSPEGELGRCSCGCERMRKVTFTKPYYMGVFEVTQGQWKNVTGDSERYCGYFYEETNSLCRPFEGYNRGYDSVRGSHGSYSPSSTHVGGNSFMAILRTRTAVGGFDLPNDAQWEYACRAGTTTALNSGKDLVDRETDGNIAEVARYFGNGYNNISYSRNSTEVGTAKVGSYRPNALGLYDMHGNVAEWCLDQFMRPAGSTELIDPKAYEKTNWMSDNQRVVRGGSWKDDAWWCRSALRDRWCSSISGFDWVGFRLYCDASF